MNNSTKYIKLRLQVTWNGNKNVSLRQTMSVESAATIFYDNIILSLRLNAGRHHASLAESAVDCDNVSQESPSSSLSDSIGTRVTIKPRSYRDDASVTWISKTHTPQILCQVTAVVFCQQLKVGNTNNSKILHSNDNQITRSWIVSSGKSSTAT